MYHSKSFEGSQNLACGREFCEEVVCAGCDFLSHNSFVILRVCLLHGCVTVLSNMYILCSLLSSPFFDAFHLEESLGLLSEMYTVFLPLLFEAMFFMLSDISAFYHVCTC
jgi:hypothetical protein